MRKRLLIACFILYFILNIWGVFAYSGVTPSFYEVDFKPNLKQSFVFTFIMPENVKSELYVEGDLSKYVRLDKKFFQGSSSVIVLLEMPEEIDIPGNHFIKVIAKETGDSGSGVRIAFAVGGVIKLKVPYPGKYAELEFGTQRVNQGEPVSFDLTVYSRGKEDIHATAYIDIYSGNDFIERLSLGTKLVESTKNKKFSGKLETENYVAGDYNATAVVIYGGEKPAVISKIFRLGTLFVGISNYSKEFEKNKINRFVIEAESFWNSEINNLYTEVEILGYDEVFRTPSVDLNPWEKTTMTGFFDTSNIKENNFQAEITLYYHNSTTSKIVELKFVKEKGNYLYLILSVILLLIIALISFFILFFKRKKKLLRK